MLGTGSSSSLSETLHNPKELILLCLLSSLSFLILALPHSVCLIICLKNSKFVSPTPWFVSETQSVTGSVGDRSGWPLLRGSSLPDTPQGIFDMLIVTTMICRKNVKDNCQKQVEVSLSYSATW